jgi:hypothetical protein
LPAARQRSCRAVSTMVDVVWIAKEYLRRSMRRAQTLPGLRESRQVKLHERHPGMCVSERGSSRQEARHA